MVINWSQSDMKRIVKEDVFFLVGEKASKVPISIFTDHTFNYFVLLTVDSCVSRSNIRQCLPLFVSTALARCSWLRPVVLMYRTVRTWLTRDSLLFLCLLAWLFITSADFVDMTDMLIGFWSFRIWSSSIDATVFSSLLLTWISAAL